MTATFPSCARVSASEATSKQSSFCSPGLSTRHLPQAHDMRLRLARPESTQHAQALCTGPLPEPPSPPKRMSCTSFQPQDSMRHSPGLTR